jgi:hypothetical protein
VEGDIIFVKRGLCTEDTAFAGQIKPAAAAGAEVVVAF